MLFFWWSMCGIKKMEKKVEEQPTIGKLLQNWK